MGVSIEFLLVPLLTAISHTLGKSSISMFSNKPEGFVIFSSLVGNPSTGKTSAMSVVKNSLINCERFLLRKNDDHKEDASSINLINDKTN